MEWTTLLHFGHFADRSPKRTAWPTLIGIVEEKDFKLILAVATSPKYRNIEPAAATTKVRWTAQKIWQKYKKTMPRFISPGIITIWPSDHLTIIAEESKQQSSIGQRTKNAHKSTLEFWNSSGNKAKKDGEFGSKFPVPPSQDGGKLTFYRQWQQLIIF